MAIIFWLNDLLRYRHEKACSFKNDFLILRFRRFYETKSPAIACGVWFIEKGLFQSIPCAAKGLTIRWLNGDFESI
jgi:hypothetical protein